MASFDNISEDNIINAVRMNDSYRSVLLSLGLTSNEYNRNRLKLFLEDKNIKFISKNGGVNSPLKSISRDELKRIVSESDTYKEVLEKIGYLNPCTGPYCSLKNKIKLWNIDTTHMTHYKKCNNEKANDATVFSKNSPHSHSTIRRYVITHKCIPYKCAYCGNIGVWNNKPLSLTLDHKNGDRNDNRIENLQFVCPNCDRQQETYGSKNKRRYFE